MSNEVTTTQANEVVAAEPTRKPRSALAEMAKRYNVSQGNLMNTLKNTVFKGKNGNQVTDEQMVALLIVADQYGLNPFTKEIYAFPGKGNDIVPMVGVDGWLRLINSQPTHKSIEFEYGPDMSEKNSIPQWIECTIVRDDRNAPIKVREYFEECFRPTEPWQKMPRRMLRNRSIVQCGRVAYSLVGIYDPDEAEQIIDMQVSESSTGVDEIDQVNMQITGTKPTDETPAEEIEPEAEQQTPADDDGNAMTFDQVLDMINKSKTLEILEVAGDCIRLVVDPAEQANLVEVCKERERAMERGED